VVVTFRHNDHVPANTRKSQTVYIIRVTICDTAHILQYSDLIKKRQKAKNWRKCHILHYRQLIRFKTCGSRK